MGPIEVVREIARRHPTMAAYSTRRIRPAPMFQERLSGKQYEPLVVMALELRTEMGLSFMDAINVALLRGAQFDDAVLKTVLFQNGEEAFEWHSIGSPTPAPDADDGAEDASGDDGAMTALTSRVRLENGELRHLAMMDFHLPAQDDALELARGIGSQIGGAGWILESGRSYHYYGSRLLTFEEMCAFLGRGLLFAPVTDRAWIGHQLIDGVCCLRTAGHPSKIGVPRVVAECESR